LFATIITDLCSSREANRAKSAALMASFFGGRAQKAADARAFARVALGRDPAGPASPLRQMPYIVNGCVVKEKPPPPLWQLPLLFLAAVWAVLKQLFVSFLPSGRPQNASVIKRPERPSGFFGGGGGGDGGGGGGGGGRGGGSAPPEPRNIKGFDNSVGSSTNNCGPAGG
jgi:hypothetical protein